MKKYTMEFVGTMFFVLSIIGIVASGSSLTPLAIGLSLATLIYIGAAVSGSHFNPAVSLALWIRGKSSQQDTIYYIIAQLLGAALAYLVATKILGLQIQPAGISSKLFAVFVAELLFTFALVTAVLHTAASKSTTGNNYYGLAIGGTVLMGALTVGGISGGFFNPAVLLGIGFFGISSSAVFTILAAHIVGSVAAAYFHQFTTGRDK